LLSYQFIQLRMVQTHTHSSDDMVIFSTVSSW